MTTGRARKKRIGKHGFLLVPDGQVRITIHGQFDRPGDEIAEVIDNALHDAGLCGCAGSANGYMLFVETSSTSDRRARSEEHDGREAARAWIADGAMGTSDPGRGEVKA